jgi:hypothetical protein
MTFRRSSLSLKGTCRPGSGEEEQGFPRRRPRRLRMRLWHPLRPSRATQLFMKSFCALLSCERSTSRMRMQTRNAALIGRSMKMLDCLVRAARTGADSTTLSGNYLDIRGRQAARPEVCASDRYDASQKLGEQVRASGGARQSDRNAPALPSTGDLGRVAATGLRSCGLDSKQELEPLSEQSDYATRHQSDHQN